MTQDEFVAMGPEARCRYRQKRDDLTAAWDVWKRATNFPPGELVERFDHGGQIGVARMIGGKRRTRRANLHGSGFTAAYEDAVSKFEV